MAHRDPELLATIISRESVAHVEVLITPFHWGHTLTMSAGGESARDVIARLGSIFHFPFSFQCLWDATRKTYYLNVKGVFCAQSALPARQAPIHSPEYRSRTRQQSVVHQGSVGFTTHRRLTSSLPSATPDKSR